MKLEMYQKVVLKDGKRGAVIEIFNDGEAYMIDVKVSDADYSGTEPIYPEYEEVTVTPKDIKSIIIEVEEPFVLPA